MHAAVLIGPTKLSPERHWKGRLHGEAVRHTFSPQGSPQLLRTILHKHCMCEPCGEAQNTLCIWYTRLQHPADKQKQAHKRP